MTDFNFERDRSDPQIYWRNSRMEEDDRFRSEEEKRTAQLQKEIDNKLLPSEIRDKVRYGGNSLPINDENRPPYSPFYVFISGHIESG